MTYFVEYNAAWMPVSYKTLKGALGYVSRKGFVNDADNMVRIVDENGDEYDAVTGEKTSN